MMHDPYGGDGQVAVYAEPQRTSVMAILSLVSSLICCIPGLGLLGAMLGVAALVGIGGSGGRVGGRGLAIAGIIIGVLCTVLWVGIYYGAQQLRGAYVGVTEPVLLDIEAGNFDAVRAAFESGSQPTDEQLTAFRATYQAEFGAFQRVPSGWFEMFAMFADPAIGPQMQQYQGAQDLIPIPGIFDGGSALVVFEFDPGAQTGGGTPVFGDLVIHRADGSEIRLSTALEPAP